MRHIPFILLILLSISLIAFPVYASSTQINTDFLTSIIKSITSFFNSMFSVLFPKSTPSVSGGGGGGGGGGPSGSPSCSGSFSLTSSGKDTCTITADIKANYCDGKSYEIKDGGNKCSGTVSGNSSTLSCNWQVTYGTYSYSFYLDNVLKSSSSVTCSQSPPPSCSDGTLYGQCSSNKPKYCNNGNLIDDCSLCNCLSGQSCNATTGSCYTPPKCSDGTLYGQCSSTKPKYCSSGTLTDKCSLCSCPSSQTCNATSDQCYTIQTCSDGTLYGQCSANKPKYCSSGTLTDKCSQCGCSAGYNCLANESCNSTTTADYTITGSGATASAVEHGGSKRTTSGATPSVITTVVNTWMSPGQIAEFIGTFTMSSDVSISKSTITLNFGTSTLSIGSGLIGFTVSGSHVSLLNGHLIGGTFAIAGNGATYMLIQGCDIYGQSGGANAGAIIFNNGCTNDIIDNCSLHDSPQPLYISANSVNNNITNTDFYGFTGGGGHGIYMDGGSSGAGHLEISGCKFHDPQPGGNAIVMKSSNNKIHNNTFFNFTGSSIPFSIYTYNGNTEDGNQIYNNTFSSVTSTEGIFWSGNVNQLTGIVNGTRIYNNTFINCNVVFYLNHETAADTRYTFIYYNTFNSCTTIFRIGTTNVFDTVVAYNTFSANVTNLDFETAYTNTMVYGNTGLEDFNVPAERIPPP